MAEVTLVGADFEEMSELPTPLGTGLAGVYFFEGALWVVFPDGTRRNLGGTSSGSFAPPVVIATGTEYVVENNTQVVVQEITIEVGATLTIEANAVLIHLN